MQDVRDRLRVCGRRIWRRRGWCVGVAWLTCALGWAGVALLPTAYRSSAVLLIETSGAAPTDWDRVAGLAPADVHRMLTARPLWQVRPGDGAASVRAAWAEGLTVEAAGPALLRISYTDDDRERARRVLDAQLAMIEPDGEAVDEDPVRPMAAEADAARLTADLEAARARRAAQARELAEVPATVAGETGEAANPVRQRLAVLLDQQDALIASLEQRLRTQAQFSRLRLVEPPARAVRVGGRRAYLLLSLVLLTGLGVGAATATLAARRDPRFDSAAELQRAVALPVLGSIARTSAPGRRRQRGAEPRLGAAWALIGLFAALLALEAFDLLAIPVARSLP